MGFLLLLKCCMPGPHDFSFVFHLSPTSHTMGKNNAFPERLVDFSFSTFSPAKKHKQYLKYTLENGKERKQFLPDVPERYRMQKHNP